MNAPAGYYDEPFFKAEDDAEVREPPAEGYYEDEFFRQREKKWSLRQFSDVLFRKDEDVDYDTGVQDFMFRAALNAMDTPEERKAYLTSALGASGWRQDSAGRYVVVREALQQKFGQTAEKDVAIDESGLSREDLADILPDILPVGGAIAAGVTASGYGAAVGIPASMAAAALGKAIQEYAIEPLAGLPNMESPGEVGINVVKEAALAATGEGIGRALAPFGRFLLGPDAWQLGPKQAQGRIVKLIEAKTGRPLKEGDRWVSLFGKRGQIVPRVKPERGALAKKIRAKGGMPTLAQAADSPLAGRVQQLMEMILGNEIDSMNYVWLKGGSRELVKRAAKGATAKAARGPAGVGRTISDAVHKTSKAASDAFDDAHQVLKQTMDDLEMMVRTASDQNLRRAPGSVTPQEFTQMAKVVGGLDNNSIDQMIRHAHKAGSDDFARAYKMLDDIVGGAPVVTTDGLRTSVDDIARVMAGVEDLPADWGEVTRLMRYINKLPPTLNFQQAQFARTVIRTTLDNPALISSPAQRFKNMLLGAIDDMMGEDTIRRILTRTSGTSYKTGPVSGLFEESAGGILIPGRTVIKSLPDPKIEEALNYKKVLDAGYANWIKRFDNVLVKRLGLDIMEERTAKALTHDMALQAIAKAQNPYHIIGLKGALNRSAGGRRLGEGSWDMVKGDLLRQWIDGSYLEGGTMHGGYMLQQIKKMKPGVLEAIFDKDAKFVTRLARDFNMFDEVPARLDPKHLSGNAFLKAMRRWRSAKIQETRMLSKNLLRQVSKGGMSPDEIADSMLQTRNKTVIKTVRDHFGKESPEWKGVQEELMRKIVKKMYVPGKDGFDEFIKGSQLDQWLSQYTNEYRDISPLIEMFGGGAAGKELAKDLIEYAKSAALLSLKPTMAGQIAAAQIALHPLRNIPLLVQFKIISKLFQTRGALRYYMEGIGHKTFRPSTAAMSRFIAQTYLLINEETRDEPWTLDVDPESDTFGAFVPNG